MHLLHNRGRHINPQSAGWRDSIGQQGASILRVASKDRRERRGKVAESAEKQQNVLHLTTTKPAYGLGDAG